VNFQDPFARAILTKHGKEQDRQLNLVRAILLDNGDNFLSPLTTLNHSEEKLGILISQIQPLNPGLLPEGNLIIKRKNILRPLSPHLPIYKPQLTSTFPNFP
jgi:hypothetical protein